MFKSNLIEILSSLDPKEFKELGDFVSSPFFNKNEAVVKLYGHLKKLYPRFDESNTSKERVYKNIFHGAEYNDAFMRSLMFKLNSLAEDFITISDFRKNSTSYHIRQADALLDRNLDGQAGKLIRQASSKLTSSRNKNAEHFYSLFSLEKLKDIIYSRTYTPLTIKDKPDEELILQSDYLIKFFLTGILQRYRYLLNKAKTVSASYELDFLIEILDYLSKDGKKFLGVDLINILYKQVLLLLNPENEKTFYELMEILTSDKAVLDKGERRDGLTVVNNYCIDRLYGGNEEYRMHLHNLHIYELERNLYARVKGGHFEPSMFNNIVTIALSLKEDEWALKFIEKYHSKLSPAIRPNTYNFTYSKYYFNKKEFEKSLQYISKVNYTDVYHKFYGRLMLITIHYELGNFETFFSALESFKKFLANDRLLTEQHKNTNSNFIKFAGALGKIKTGASNEDPGIIKKQISDCSGTTYRGWLLNKADELAVLKK